MRKRNTLLEPVSPGTRTKVAWCGHTVGIVRLIYLFNTKLEEILRTYTVQDPSDPKEQ
jgi:hypothetical protein